MQAIRSTLKYAATILLLITVGSIIYLQTRPSNQEFTFSDTNITSYSGEPRLLLHTGEEISLERSQSSVEIFSDEEIIINKERVIKMQTSQGQREGFERMNEIIVPYGNTSRLTLPDGSLVWLNAGSRMAFSPNFSGKERIVYLEGEAYFEVAHDINKAFKVKAGNVTVIALGTIFNVSAYPNDELIKSFLLEGKISVSEGHSRSARDNIIIEPNQVAVYSTTNKDISVAHVSDPYEFIAWKEGWFRCNRENLRSVLRKLERYYGVKIFMDETGSSFGKFSGKLDVSGSIEKVLIVLSDVTEIEYRIEDEGIFIKPKDSL
jgi:transmembrane sensor